MRQNDSHTLSGVFLKTSRICIYLAAFLIPLLFSPFTVEVLEVNKQTGLILLSCVAVIAWFGSMLAEKKISWKADVSVVLSILLLVSLAISSATSLAPYTSWVGQALQEYTSFFTFLSLVGLFIVGIHVLTESRHHRTLWFHVCLSAGIIGFLTVLAFFGLPIFDINLIGTPNALGVYLLVMAITGSVFLLVSKRDTSELHQSKLSALITSISVAITSLATLVVLGGTDYWVLWIAAIVGLVAYFGFVFLRAEEFTHIGNLIFPMLLLVVSILFLFLPSALAGKYAVEISPSYEASWDITKQVFKNHSPLFGTGPGTFGVNYVAYKSPELNQTLLWDVRFDRSVSHYFTLLPSIGIIGTLLMALLVLYIFLQALYFLATEKVNDDWRTIFVAFPGWLVLVVTSILYSSNVTLHFLFWLFSLVLISRLGAEIKSSTFSQSPRAALGTTFTFVLFAVGMLTVMFVGASRYVAEATFAKAVVADGADENLDKVIEYLNTSARLNKMSDIYYRNLGHALLLKTANLVQDPDANPDDISLHVQTSVAAAMRATELSPSQASNWATLGDILREYVAIIGDADVASISAYEHAIALAPTNPKYQVSLGRAYIVRADRIASLLPNDDAEFTEKAQKAYAESLSLAVEAFQRASELKSDYASAHYYLALAYDRQGNVNDAVLHMEGLRKDHRQDIGVALQLGLLYLKQGKNEAAKAEFERAIEIDPTFSNARWYLSVVYEQSGEIDLAIEEVEIIKQLNPENSLIDQRLQRLIDGKSVEQFPVPLEEGEGQDVEIDD